MPDIVVGAFTSTEEILPDAGAGLPDEKVVDMDPKIRKLDPDSTQFTTMIATRCRRASRHGRSSTGWRSST